MRMFADSDADGSPGVCDCHSHVFGPYARFPLSPVRTYDPPESTAEELEAVWRSLGIGRAVLIQGSAHGDDHRAMLDALGRSPATRRGVALLDASVTAKTLAEMHARGVRGVRFNWLSHLLRNDARTAEKRLSDAALVLETIAPFGWHVELHVDVADLTLVQRLSVPRGMAVVIDHMGRSADGLQALLRLLGSEAYWVKLSGADRLACASDSMDVARDAMERLLRAAPERCVWGLDWPHVNLDRRRPDEELAELLLRVAGDETTLKRVLIANPARLYDFGVD